jgi:hypothetical protein
MRFPYRRACASDPVVSNRMFKAMVSLSAERFERPMSHMTHLLDGLLGGGGADDGQQGNSGKNLHDG